MQADDSLSNRAGLDVNDTAVDRCADDTAVGTGAMVQR